MKNSIIIIGLFISISSFAQNKNEALEKQIDFIIEEKDCFEVEFPAIYDSLATSIPCDSCESLAIVQILKAKGFLITNWGRGNHMQGPRIVVFTMTKDDCECEVIKYYYSMPEERLYKMAERIKCCRIEE